MTTLAPAPGIDHPPAPATEPDAESGDAPGPGQMRAVRWHGIGDLRLDTVDVPAAPLPTEVQVRVLSCGICGTDTEKLRHGAATVLSAPIDPATGERPPTIIGHEVAGVVAAVGDRVTTAAVGDLVVMDTLIPCGVCDPCRRGLSNLCDDLVMLGLSADGGMAPLCNAPEAMIRVVPPSVSADAAAIAETLAVAVRAVRQAELHAGDVVTVVGGGAVGLLIAQTARAAGAVVTLVEPSPLRREVAAGMGLETVGPEHAPIGTAAVSLECSGSHPGARTALNAVRKGGRVVLVGVYAGAMQIDVKRIVTQELQIVGSFSHQTTQDLEPAIALLASGVLDVEPLCDTRVGLADAIRVGFPRPGEGDPATIKVLVHPQE